MRFPGFEGEWEKSLIGEILKIGSGKDYKHLSDGEIPVFGTGGYMTSVNDYLFEGETVCIGRKGTINKPFYYKGKLWTVDTLFYTHSYENILPRFVSYLFERINWLKYNEASGVPSLSKRTIEQIEIYIPNISEQKKLANFLVLLNERIQTQNKIIAQLESLMRSLRGQLFTQKIRFRSNNKSAFQNWETRKIGEFVEFHRGSSLSKVDISEYGRTKCIHYGELFTVYQEVISKIISQTDKQGFRSKIGDILMPSSDVTPLGLARASVILENNVILGGDINILRPLDSACINSVFLSYLLNYEKKKIMMLVSGTTIKHIYSKNLKDIQLNIPTSIEEQIVIANLFSSIDEKIKIEESISKNYDQQKKYLLQNLFI